jgi:hypothetical protein
MGWIERKDQEPREWQEAAQLNDVALYLTAAELEEMGSAIWSLFEPYLARAERAELRPEGARTVTVLNLAFPGRRPDEEAGG